jgi:hypothetical protein
MRPIGDKPNRGHRCVWCDSRRKTFVNVSVRPVKSQETKKFGLINTGITGIHNYLKLGRVGMANLLKLNKFYQYTLGAAIGLPACGAAIPLG